MYSHYLQYMRSPATAENLSWQCGAVSPVSLEAVACRSPQIQAQPQGTTSGQWPAHHELLHWDGWEPKQSR